MWLPGQGYPCVMPPCHLQNHWLHWNGRRNRKACASWNKGVSMDHQNRKPQVASTKWLILRHPTWRNKKTRKRNKSKIFEPWWSVFVNFHHLFLAPRLFSPKKTAVEVPNSSASLVRSCGPRCHNLQALGSREAPGRLRTSMNFFGDVKGYENTGFC